jgi:hypothetical protein
VTIKRFIVFIASDLPLLAVLAAMLSGCGLSHLPIGPLGTVAENDVVVGQPVPQGGADTIGDEVMFNGGSAPIVVDRLVLRSPRRIKLTGVYLTVGGPVGNWPTFPPSFPTGPRARYYDRYMIRAWAHRHKPAGTIIPPHTWAGVALGLEATSAHGSVAGVDVYYHVGRAQYEWHGKVQVVLTRVSCRPPISRPDRVFCHLFRGA